MNIAIVGFDTEGRATYDFFASQGHALTICDQNTSVLVPAGAEAQLGEGYLNDLSRFDLVVRTAGLQPGKIIEANPGIESKISTHINEFLKVCPTTHVIGVTGTKGKGTTSSLITGMIEAHDVTVRLGGNIGVPPLTFLRDLDENSWVVLELSSFQLIDLQRSPHIGVCLMVVPEHLNWHADMDEYIGAKSQLFAHQQADDIAVYFAQNALSQQIAGAGLARKVPYFAAPGAFVDHESIIIEGQTVCDVTDLKLLGRHNWQNACAAVTAVWQAGFHDTDALHSVLTSFSGLEHRLEFVRELNGVTYYDDSFGTTPETALVAIQSFEQPKVVILGGSDKGASYDELAAAIAQSSVRRVLLIGDQAKRIQTALETAGFTNFIPGGATMADIVATARATAEAGDVVLLSTGCASFDMFKDYKDRGDQFKQAVQALA